jgi:hypothetical protein
MSGKLDRYTIVIDGDNKKLELAARKTVGDLGKVDRAAKGANGGVGRLSTGLRQASTNAAVFQGPLGGVSGRLGAMSSLLGSVNPLMVGFGAAVSGVTLFMASAVKEHDLLALRNKKQESLLRSTGHAAGFAAHELDAMAKSVALNTLASVEGIKDTQNVLLTFKGVSRSAFRDAITLSQDMAAVMGGDSKSAALQLGKALESPTEGVSALKRAGVSFTQGQRDMIREMEETGRVSEAQTFILDTLKNQIGGAGQGEAGTLSGALDTLAQRWQHLKVVVADSSGATGFMENLAIGMANIVDRVGHMVSPDDDSRMAELWIKAQNLNGEMDRLKETGDTTFFSTNADLLNTAKLELVAVNQEIEEIEARQKQRKSAEEVASAAAIANEKARSAELLAEKKALEDKKTEITQAKYASDLTAMDTQFAGETQKVTAQYDANIKRIEAWQLSEQEVKARGFETMAELQESYRLLADEKRTADLAAVAEKEAAAEEARTAKAKDESTKRAANEATAQKNGLAALQSSTAMFTGALRESAGEKSAIYKAAFAAQKAAALPGMLVSTEEGATKALSLGPVAGPIAAGTIRAMGYASMGMVAGQAIAGAFENGGIVGGNSYTGDNLTAFVNSSEMILNRPQQKQLFDMANGSGGGSGGVVVNVIEDASKAGQTSREGGLTQEDVINIYVSNVTQAGAAAQINEQVYGLERVGR